METKYTESRLVRLIGVIGLAISLGIECLREAHAADVYVDKGACPFECCTYRAWRVVKPFRLYDAIGSGTAIEKVAAGGKIQALTGEVHSVPYRTQAISDVPVQKIRKGDEVFFLVSLGEGFWKVRHQGRIIELDDAESVTDFAERTKKVPIQSQWWIRLRSPSGKTGWTKEDDQFFGPDMDSCS
ncbi:MAG: hypothetical protein HY696_08020 [Deltaproteobacteria bacterium]|nr:hypothetical protein [Deltaproteobacteria bacterium]